MRYTSSIGEEIEKKRILNLRRFGRRPHYLCSQRLEDVHLFLTHFLRHCDDAPIALDGRCQGNADATALVRMEEREAKNEYEWRHNVTHAYMYINPSQNAVAGHSMRHSRVAARRFDEGVAGLDPALPLGVFDHPPADPILDTSPGIEEFALGENLHALRCQAGHLLGDGVEPHEGRVADGREDVGADGISGGNEGRQSRSGGGVITLLDAFGRIAFDVTGGRLRIFGDCSGGGGGGGGCTSTLLGRAGVVRRRGRGWTSLLGHVCGVVLECNNDVALRLRVRCGAGNHADDGMVDAMMR